MASSERTLRKGVGYIGTEMDHGETVEQTRLADHIELHA